MKALLVIDVEEDMIGEVDYTVLTKGNMCNGRALLKPTPNKIDQGYPCDKYDEGYGDGWDACIDEILGEEE